MLDVEIEQFETHYHLPGSLLDQRSRLERVFQTMIDHCLAAALERAGVDPDCELCVREIRVPVHLRWSESDDELARAWSLSFARSVQAALRPGGADWVARYESRPAALLHFAVAVADGDVTLAWSWRQLFFPAGPVPTSLPVAAQRLVQTLLEQAKQIVPVVRGVAARGRLEPLLHRLSDDQWVALIDAALGVAGTSGLTSGWWNPPPAAADDLARHLGQATTDSATPAADRQALAPRAAAIVRSLPQSRIGRAASRLRATALAPRLRAGLVLLAALEVEPACLMADSEIVGQLAAMLAAELFEGSGAAAAQAHESSRQAHAGSAPADELRSPDGQTPAAEHDDSAPGLLAASAGQRPRTSDRGKDLPATPRPARPEAEMVSTSPATGPVEAPAQSAPAELANHAAIGRRQRAVTQAGGLLLLIHVIDQLEIPRAVVAGGRWPALAARPLRWVLHQLALRLAGVEPGDAAALALAGLSPGSRPPSLDSPAPTPAELAELQRMGDTIVQATRQRLLDFAAARRGREVERSSEMSLPDDRLLEWLIHRPARLEADPGWIAAYFDLRDVSTEIRGAGLDLDPGYVPWLGVVIKFHYE
ncbi:MAG: hypothetical protein J5I93_20835 [Pirellulaceae bacterium]|nr:hypothetical protein [Pirellulaceae bacterium]